MIGQCSVSLVEACARWGFRRAGLSRTLLGTAPRERRLPLDAGVLGTVLPGNGPPGYEGLLGTRASRPHSHFRGLRPRAGGTPAFPGGCAPHRAAVRAAGLPGQSEVEAEAVFGPVRSAFAAPAFEVQLEPAGRTGQPPPEPVAAFSLRRLPVPDVGRRCPEAPEHACSPAQLRIHAHGGRGPAGAVPTSGAVRAGTGGGHPGSRGSVRRDGGSSAGGAGGRSGTGHRHRPGRASGAREGEGAPAPPVRATGLAPRLPAAAASTLQGDTDAGGRAHAPAPAADVAALTPRGSAAESGVRVAGVVQP